MKKYFPLLCVILAIACMGIFAACGEDNTESAHMHSYSADWSSDDNYHWHAATCGHDVAGQKIEHSFGEWFTDTEADYEGTGSKHRTCSVCGFEQNEVIPKLEKKEYTISFDLNGGQNNANNPTRYDSTMENIVLQNPTRGDLDFVEWRYNGQRITTIDTKSARDYVLEAIWSTTLKKNNKSDENAVVADGIIAIDTDAFRNMTFVRSVTLPTTLNNVKANAFAGCSSLVAVYYKGSAEEWQSISIASGNSCLLSATIYYYAESHPTEAGKYWHYNEGEIIEYAAGEHVYANNYTCVSRTCAICGYVQGVTTDHDPDENCVCTICGQTLHNLNANCVCTACGQTLHNLDANCVCTACGNTAHTPDVNCVCTVCGRTAHMLDTNCLCANCKKTLHGTKDGAYCRHGDYIYFGMYPQTIKSDSVNITTTTDARGYYLGSDGEHYAKVTATPYDNRYTFSTVATVTGGTVYYFKVEPIRWKILSEANGEAFILCDRIIANHRYAASSNNYANSEIRAWLNDAFYNTAFSALQQGIIEITEVDNSARSTNPDSNATLWNSGNNSYACANTNDKIFLLSEQEVTTAAYGFSSYDSYDTARRKRTSDYSRATGAYMSIYPSKYDNGLWWVRSPSSYYSNRAGCVGDDGYANGGNDVNRTLGGVVPALRIKL